MRFVGRVLGIIATSTALILGASTVASAAVVKAPGTASSAQPAAVWDERAIVDTALEGEGLVFDILDVTGFGFGASEFECADCDVAFSGLHESFSPGRPGGGGGAAGGGSGWGGPWKSAASTGLHPRAAAATVDNKGKKGNKSPSAGTPGEKTTGLEPVFVPPSLTSGAPLQEQLFSPPSFCLDDCGPPADTTDGGDNGGSDNGGGDSGGSSGAGAVPEPGSMLLLGSGMLGLAVAVRRRLRR